VQVEGELADKATHALGSCLTSTLRQIVAATPPNDLWAPYHEAQLRRARKAIQVGTPADVIQATYMLLHTRVLRLHACDLCQRGSVASGPLLWWLWLRASICLGPSQHHLPGLGCISRVACAQPTVPAGADSPSCGCCRALQVGPPGSMERHERRVHLLHDIRATLQSGQCCTPYPFVAALQELEVEEDVCGAAVPCHSQVGSRGVMWAVSWGVGCGCICSCRHGMVPLYDGVACLG
jgi:hypothetical protein